MRRAESFKAIGALGGDCIVALPNSLGRADVARNSFDWWLKLFPSLSVTNDGGFCCSLSLEDSTLCFHVLLVLCFFLKPAFWREKSLEL